MVLSSTRWRRSRRTCTGFPSRGLYHGEKLIFTRDADGRATQVEAASVVFKRRNAGAERRRAPFRIQPLRPVEELLTEALAAKPPAEAGEFREPDLVELTTLEPTIKLDIRYATTNNFLGTPFTREPRAFLQRPAAEALVRAHRKLTEQGYGLLDPRCLPPVVRDQDVLGRDARRQEAVRRRPGEGLAPQPRRGGRPDARTT